VFLGMLVLSLMVADSLLADGACDRKTRRSNRRENILTWVSEWSSRTWFWLRVVVAVEIKSQNPGISCHHRDCLRLSIWGD
jgi:hypothetical protein